MVALCFPEYDDPAPVEPPLLSIAAAQRYGVRLGLAAAVATAIAFYFGAEHTGWIVISTVIVMRPAEEMMKVRSAGRAISVFIGALVAAWLLGLDLSPAAIAFVGAGAIIAACATNASRWYITPAFTTFLILWSVLYGNPTTENISYRSWERVLDTLLGVGIAYFFGLLVPTLSRRHDRCSARLLHRRPHDGLLAGTAEGRRDPLSLAQGERAFTLSLATSDLDEVSMSNSYEVRLQGVVSREFSRPCAQGTRCRPTRFSTATFKIKPHSTVCWHGSATSVSKSSTSNGFGTTHRCMSADHRLCGCQLAVRVTPSRVRRPHP